MYCPTFIKLKFPKPEDLSWSPKTELFFVPDGRMELYIGKDSFDLKSGELLCVSPFELYSIKRVEGLCLCLTLDLKAFGAYCHIDTPLRLKLNTVNTPLSQDHRDTLPAAHSLIPLIIQVLNTILNDRLPELARKKAEFDLLSELLLNFGEPTSDNENGRELLSDVLTYIEKNYSTPIAVQDIARHCHISPAYLSHLFQAKLKMTPSQFLQQTRLKHAKILLSQPLTLTQTAIASGFKNLRNLNHTFIKNEHMLPAQYRKITGPQQNTAFLPDLEQYLKTQTNITIQPPEERAAISLSSTPGHELPEHLFRLLELGPATKLQKPKYRRLLKTVQQQLHFQYIRLTGIFDHGLLGYIELGDHINWDFSNLDDVLEYVISNGLTPILTISSIPNILSQNGQSQYFGYSNVGLPSDFTYWETLIHDFLTHLLEKFGPDEISKWKMAISFLPSFYLSARGQTSCSEAEYLQEIMPAFILYKKTYGVIRALCPQICIGAPEGDIEDLTLSDHLLTWIFHFFEENNCLPDYFPYHDHIGLMKKSEAYQQEVISVRHVCVSENIGRLRHLFYKIQTLCPKSISIYCTGRFLMPRSIVSETVFSGAEKTSYMLNASPYLDMAGISIDNLIKEILEKFPETGEKSSLSLTGQFIRRPFYYAFWEILKLQSPVLFHNEHLLVTGSPEKVVILAVNVPSFSYQIHLPREAHLHLPISVESGHYYSSFGKPLDQYEKNINEIIGGNPLSLSISLKNFLPYSYLLECIIINTRHGSAYDEWLREGAFTLFEPADCEHINHRTFPARIKKIITPDAGTYNLNCILEPCEIRMISLTAMRPDK